MEDNLKSKFGFCLFFIIVFTLLIGGYFFMKFYLKEDNNIIKEESYKIDTKKDYIYYINESVISESGEIYYKDVVINLSSQKVLTEALEKENKIYKNNIKYISEEQYLNNDIIAYNNDNIYSLMFRTYNNYEFGKYITLVVNDYDYSCLTGVTFNNAKAYVFNTENGSRLTENQLLNMYNLNIDRVKEKVKIYLEEKQSKIDGVLVINIDETLDNLNLNGLYINEYGKLIVSYLVKTTQTDYNEITEVG